MSRRKEPKETVQIFTRSGIHESLHLNLFVNFCMILIINFAVFAFELGDTDIVSACPESHAPRNWSVNQVVSFIQS